MDWGQKHLYKNDVVINFLRAKHWSKRAMWGKNSTLWGAFALETKRGNIYFAGDTGYDDHFLEAQSQFKKFKIALLPIGAYKPEDFMIHHHMSPQQAIQAHQDLNSDLSIAMHFETFKLASDNFFDASTDLQKFSQQYDLQNKFLIIPVGQKIEQ